MRKPICCVCGCNREGFKKIGVDRRGGGNAYLCSYHADDNEYYGTSNNNIVGTTKKNAIMIGAEHELSFADLKGRTEFSIMGMIPTDDSSLSDEQRRYCEVEFVAPTMNGLNKISKDAVSIEKLFVSGHCEANDSCGTHLHVSTENTRNNIDENHGMTPIRRFYNSLFVPVTEVMKRNSDATKALFGRYFTGYAPAINMDTEQRAGHNETRYVWVNCTNSNRIEYRLVKFRNAKQYMHVVKMCVEMTKIVDKWFLAKFNPTKIDTTRYSSIKEYRKHCADMTAKKLIDTYKKYCADIGYTVA